MMFPLSVHFGHEAGLILGTLIGIGFGFTLEPACCTKAEALPSLPSLWIGITATLPPL